MPPGLVAKGLADGFLQSLQKALGGFKPNRGLGGGGGRCGGGGGGMAASGLKASPLGMGAFREPGQETPCATFNKSLPWVFHAAGQLSRLKQE